MADRKILPAARKWARRATHALLWPLAIYLLIACLGLLPVNNDFVTAIDGIEIYIISNSVHADIVVPLQARNRDWRPLFPDSAFRGDTSLATHAAIGWGDRGFFLETPTWSDLTLSTAANALLWPSDSCLHVYLTTPNRLTTDRRSVRLSPAQYDRLCQFIDRSFTKDAQGNYQSIAGFSYGFQDAFFEAQGHYHAFDTCNCWVGRALRHAGVRVGWFTPLPKTVYLYLPKRAP